MTAAAGATTAAGATAGTVAAAAAAAEVGSGGLWERDWLGDSAAGGVVCCLFLHTSLFLVIIFVLFYLTLTLLVFEFLYLRKKTK